MWILLLLASFIALPAVAEPVSRVDVVVINLPRWNARAISRSTAQAARLFHGTAIRLDWSTQTTPKLAPPANSHPRRLIILLDRRAMARFPSFSRATLGLALHDRAYVLVPRIERLAATQGVPASTVLGAVIAHELGHLLLGPGHTPTGIMRPVCGLAEFDLAGRGQPGFSRFQAHQMQARLRLFR